MNTDVQVLKEAFSHITKKEGSTTSVCYVSRGHALVDKIHDVLAENSHDREYVLIFSQTRSGITTELHKLAEKLNASHFVVAVEPQRLILPNHLTYNAIVLFMTMAFLRAIIEGSLTTEDKFDWKYIYNVIKSKVMDGISDEETSSPPSYNHSSVIGLVNRIEQDLLYNPKNRQIIMKNVSGEGVLYSMIYVINMLVLTHRKPVLFIVDDINKVGHGKAEEIFRDALIKRHYLKPSVIYTAPLSLLYSSQLFNTSGDDQEAESTSDRFKLFRFCAVPILNRDGTLNQNNYLFIENIIRNYLPDDALSPQAKKSIILASGGLVGSLLFLLQNSILSALSRNSSVVEMVDVERAIRETRIYLSSHEQQVISNLSQLRSSSDIDNQTFCDLLDRNAILEYANREEIWHEINPAVNIDVLKSSAIDTRQKVNSVCMSR